MTLAAVFTELPKSRQLRSERPQASRNRITSRVYAPHPRKAQTSAPARGNKKSCVLPHSTEPTLGLQKKKIVDTSTPKAVASLEREQSTRHGRPLTDRFALHLPTLLHSDGR